MELQLPSSIKHGAHRLLAKNITSPALKEHSQISVIIDALSRREHHHVLLTGSTSEKINFSLMETLSLHLAAPTTPKTIRDAELIYIDIAQLELEDADTQHDLLVLRDEIRRTNKRAILAINQISPLLPEKSHSDLGKFIKLILADDQWRVIVLTSQQILPLSFPLFLTLHLNEPSKNEMLTLLKSYRTELENFHQVIIPDETISSALAMATHYLHGHSRLDEAIELLDSSAARASANDRHDAAGQVKPIVTTMLLSNIVSNRTQIPVSHLHNNKFQAIQFTAAMQRRVFGQEAATAMVGSILQHACIKLRKKNGPLCGFLFAGPSDVGKTETAFAMAEHLFGHPGALLHVNLTKTHYASFNDIKVISESHDNRCVSLLQAIRQTPYAVVLIENINQAPAGTLDFFKDIFIHGFTVDAEGNQYDFRNAIIVMTTTLGADKISQLMQSPQLHEPTKSVDLMQLVLNENLHEPTTQTSHQLTPEELCDELMPTLEAYFSANLLQSLNVVPFIPLDYAALEKISRIKIKALAKQLDVNFGIELSYAPEVIKFIAHEALWRKPNVKSMDKLLEMHLYSCVAHEILAQSENKNRPKRLLLQLNENGQLLKCEFVAASDGAVYTL
jgi:ATP-dependent Clp protease ATP-binding subunit ClpA